METILIVGLALLLFSRRQAPAPGPGPMMAPGGYPGGFRYGFGGPTPGVDAQLGAAINMGGAVGVPILSAAVNGLSRPLSGSYGLTSGGVMSDPAWGNPGASQYDLGAAGPSGFDPSGADMGGYYAPQTFDLEPSFSGGFEADSNWG